MSIDEKLEEHLGKVAKMTFDGREYKGEINLSGEGDFYVGQTKIVEGCRVLISWEEGMDSLNGSSIIFNKRNSSLGGKVLRYKSYNF
jgi:hypothetical protein